VVITSVINITTTVIERLIVIRPAPTIGACRRSVVPSRMMAG
jgi:hypothetical protein